MRNHNRHGFLYAQIPPALVICKSLQTSHKIIPSYILNPEVPDGLGPRTQMNRDVNPPQITHLHVVFDGWIGDLLVESFPCYLVADSLELSIREKKFPDMKSKRPMLRHIDLADGKPVKAAGSVYFRNGKISEIDNASGHYNPVGESAKAAAIKAFKEDGYDVKEDLYIEKEWNGRKWAPQ